MTKMKTNSLLWNFFLHKINQIYLNTNRTQKVKQTYINAKRTYINIKEADAEIYAGGGFFFFFLKSNASQIIVFYVRKRVSLSKWPWKEQWMLYNELLCQAADLPTTAYEHPVSKDPWPWGHESNNCRSGLRWHHSHAYCPFCLGVKDFMEIWTICGAYLASPMRFSADKVIFTQFAL